MSDLSLLRKGRVEDHTGKADSYQALPTPSPALPLSLLGRVYKRNSCRNGKVKRNTFY
jgi:hypothetical protein